MSALRQNPLSSMGAKAPWISNAAWSDGCHLLRVQHPMDIWGCGILQQHAKNIKKHNFKKTLDFNLNYDSLVSKIEGHNHVHLSSLIFTGKINRSRKQQGCQVRGPKICCTHLTPRQPRSVRFFIGGNKPVASRASNAFAMAGLMLKLLRFRQQRASCFKHVSNSICNSVAKHILKTLKCTCFTQVYSSKMLQLLTSPGCPSIWPIDSHQRRPAKLLEPGPAPPVVKPPHPRLRQRQRRPGQLGRTWNWHEMNKINE